MKFSSGNFSSKTTQATKCGFGRQNAVNGRQKVRATKCSQWMDDKIQNTRQKADQSIYTQVPQSGMRATAGWKANTIAMLWLYQCILLSAHGRNDQLLSRRCCSTLNENFSRLIIGLFHARYVNRLRPSFQRKTNSISATL